MAIPSKKAVLFRNLAAFWLFGLCNNYAYVIMLSAAEDIMDKQQNKTNTDETNCLPSITEPHCSSVSTGAVLLADILPTLLIKLTFPFFMQRIPFGVRHGTVCILQIICYLVVAYSVSVPMSLVGVVFAAMGSGLGEITYLSMASHFPRSMISAWSSGTGGAGLIGSLAYAGLTEPHLANLSPKDACLVMLIVPLIFALSYWFLMVVPDTVHQVEIFNPKTWIVPLDGSVSSSTCSTVKVGRFDDENAWGAGDGPIRPRKSTSTASTDSGLVPQRKLAFSEKLELILPMLKYMIPLGLVYSGEYLINQGLTELIYFDCKHGFHMSRHSQYRWYQVLYQIGVFVSRSSVNLVKLPLWILLMLPVLQMLNAVFFTFDAVYFFIPQIWIVFIIIFYEGLLGGAAYVNTFDKIYRKVAPDVREYCLSIATTADAMGIVIAGFAAIPLHNYVCNQQAYHIG